MQQRWSLSRSELLAQRPHGVAEDVHVPESLVASVITTYTGEGDRILDPFAGFGTTAVVAARMRRRSVAVELLPDRAALIRQRLDAVGARHSLARVIVGDARHIGTLVRGRFDLCLTSPPYMSAVEHPENPLTGYRTLDGDYARYLDELESTFRVIVGRLRAGGHLVVNVADVGHAETVTPLVADLTDRIARHARLRQHVRLVWDRPPSPTVVNDALLVFEKVDVRP